MTVIPIQVTVDLPEDEVPRAVAGRRALAVGCARRRAGLPSAEVRGWRRRVGVRVRVGGRWCAQRRVGRASRMSAASRAG